MVPALVPRGDRSSSTLTPTLVCVIVVSTVTAAMAIFTIIFSRFVRRRQQRQQGEEAPKADPQSKKPEKLARKKKMSDLDRTEEEELQRQIMIRKSLASRASCRTASQMSQSSDEDDEPEAQQPPNDFRREWKEFEANIQHKRSLSTESHPGLDPGFSGTFYSLPRPPTSRPASPARHPRLSSSLKAAGSSPLPGSSLSRESMIDGTSREDLQALRRNIQQQILRKNSEGKA